MSRLPLPSVPTIIISPALSAHESTANLSTAQQASPSIRSGSTTSLLSSGSASFAQRLRTMVSMPSLRRKGEGKGKGKERAQEIDLESSAHDYLPLPSSSGASVVSSTEGDGREMRVPLRRAISAGNLRQMADMAAAKAAHLNQLVRLRDNTESSTLPSNYKAIRAEVRREMSSTEKIDKEAALARYTALKDTQKLQADSEDKPQSELRTDAEIYKAALEVTLTPRESTKEMKSSMYQTLRRKYRTVGRSKTEASTLAALQLPIAKITVTAVGSVEKMTGSSLGRRKKRREAAEFRDEMKEAKLAQRNATEPANDTSSFSSIRAGTATERDADVFSALSEETRGSLERLLKSVDRDGFETAFAKASPRARRALDDYDWGLDDRDQPSSSATSRPQTPIASTSRVKADD